MVWAVDDRFPLSFYYRIANQIVRQAKVYRDEGNLGDLYQALNRYSRLMSETIPLHRSFSTYSSKEKLHHKKILQEFTKELEKLKLLFGKKDNEIIKQTANMSKQSDDESHLTSQRWRWKDQAFSSYNEGKASRCSSIGNKSHRSESSAAKENVKLVSDLIVDKRAGCTPFQASYPVAVIAAKGQDITMYKVRHHFPSPVHSFVEKLPLVGNVSQITVPESKNKNLETSWEAPSASRLTHDIHISARLMEEFMELARANTETNLETCGILGAFLKDRTFYVTTLIIPKQETNSNSCQALNEEEIYSIQEQQSLFPVGWIHTHPSQTCFLSSIDLHTQYSYQVMLPEAIAIVMAPTDPTRSYGIFRLSDPGGITILRECDERGFHSHPETADGSPIYESCSNVYVNPNLRFEIIDLRSPSYD